MNNKKANKNDLKRTGLAIVFYFCFMIVKCCLYVSIYEAPLVPIIIDLAFNTVLICIAVDLAVFFFEDKKDEDNQ